MATWGGYSGKDYMKYVQLLPVVGSVGANTSWECDLTYHQIDDG